MPAVHSLNRARSLVTFCGAVGLPLGAYALAVWRFVVPFHTGNSVGPGLVDGGILIENPSIFPAAALLPAITTGMSLASGAGLSFAGYHLSRNSSAVQMRYTVMGFTLVGTLLWLATYIYCVVYPPVLPQPVVVVTDHDITVPWRLQVGPDWLMLAGGFVLILVAAVAGLRMLGYRFARSSTPGGREERAQFPHSRHASG